MCAVPGLAAGASASASAAALLGLPKPVALGAKEAKDAMAHLLGDGPEHVMCYAKLEDYVNVDLSPDPSGKCEVCLDEVDTRQACFK